jgi:hypothetical protein
VNWDVDFKLHVSGNTVINGTVKDGKLQAWDITPSARRKDVVVCQPQICVSTGPAVPASVIVKKDAKLDWAAFLGQHDLVWEVLPQKFDHGIFHGNGMLGCTMFQDAPNRFRWEMGRSDVTEHRRDNARLPIGGMGLETVGKITHGTARLDLWNAEAVGELQTEKGTIKFRTFIHAIDMIMVVDIEASGEERSAKFSWLAADAVDKRNVKFKDPANPLLRMETDGDVSLCVQPRYAGGEFATAWQEVKTGPDKRRLVISLADRFPGNGAGKAAAECVRKAVSADSNGLRASHRDWWHAYYPASFLSVPDAQIEGFYWIQMYKLACATRKDRQVIDLLGPWYRSTSWPRIWWNLNIQLAYSPVYVANRLELGESFTRFIDAKRANFVLNAKEIWKFDDCATVPHTTCYEGLRGDGTCAPEAFINPGDFTWALWLYWQQYRYSMDDAFVTNQQQHAFYPLLKGSINLYLKLLKPGADGKLHLPPMHSPEYSQTPYPDNNYNLSLLRWGCTRLLYLNARYGFKDPQRAEWERVLRDLVPSPQNENGFMIGATQAFEHSHRHWSHLLMVWPLRLLSVEQPENKALVEKTLKHWLTVENGKQIYGWSSAAASCLYSCMGDGDHALANLRAHHNNQKFVMPNTQYIEGSPVIECSLVAATALQSMLLQSGDDYIRIFPAVPAEWKDAVFHDLRTEGAFLVSAARRGGKTRWVSIKSLAGEPCKVRLGFDGAFKTSQPSIKIKEVEPGLFELGLGKGQEIIIFQETDDSRPEVAACHPPKESVNVWGVKAPQKDLTATDHP